MRLPFGPVLSRHEAYEPDEKDDNANIVEAPMMNHFMITILVLQLLNLRLHCTARNPSVVMSRYVLVSRQLSGISSGYTSCKQHPSAPINRSSVIDIVA